MEGEITVWLTLHFVPSPDVPRKIETCESESLKPPFPFHGPW